MVVRRLDALPDWWFEQMPVSYLAGFSSMMTPHTEVFCASNWTSSSRWEATFFTGSVVGY